MPNDTYTATEITKYWVHFDAGLNSPSNEDRMPAIWLYGAGSDTDPVAMIDFQPDDGKSLPNPKKENNGSLSFTYRRSAYPDVIDLLRNSNSLRVIFIQDSLIRGGLETLSLQGVGQG